MPRPALLVELAGSNGVGKSTIAPLLAKRLRERLDPDRVAALPEKDVPRFRRRWTRIQRRLWLATHPASAWSAWRSATPGDWFFARSTLGLARRALRQGCLVALVDQGLLRAARDPAEIETFTRALLPDLVMHLVSDTATTTLRQLLRTKKNHTRFQGAEREIQARAHRAKLEGLPPDQIRKAMHAFARNFCEPALDTETIEAVCAKTGDPVPLDQKPPTRCAPEVMESLRLRGVDIETIVNSFPRSPEDCVEACLRPILSRLEIPEAQW
jgi:hypothetical protein